VAHTIQRRSGVDSASVDDLREAFQHYRALFDDLLADSAGVDHDAATDEDAGNDRDLSATFPASTT
jgi:hypothetical protein